MRQCVDHEGDVLVATPLMEAREQTRHPNHSLRRCDGRHDLPWPWVPHRTDCQDCKDYKEDCTDCKDYKQDGKHCEDQKGCGRL